MHYEVSWDFLSLYLYFYILASILARVSPPITKPGETLTHNYAFPEHIAHKGQQFNEK